jgi:hypothetical protein
MSGRLRTEDRLAQPDELYQLLIEAHQGLSPEQSRQLDARLILLLANHLGDLEAIAEAVAVARRSVVGERRA